MSIPPRRGPRRRAASLPLDVAVVGAGAAGLATARDLVEAGLSVLVLEARGRAGGRILTVRPRGAALPIEMGAEFIHGDAPETERLLREAGGVACDIAGEHRAAGRGRLRPISYWGSVDRVLRRIDASRPDQSFASFLREQPGGKALARDRAVARRFVEGFHAADTERIGQRSLAFGGGDAPSAAAATIARIPAGYDLVPRWLMRRLRGRVRLRCRVDRVAWKRGAVELTVRAHGRAARVRARAAVVTLPAGVLKARSRAPGGVAFDPDPPGLRRALEGLAMGSVIRLVVQLRGRLWEERTSAPLEPSARRLSFLHMNRGPFQVWWTSYPAMTDMVVAWCGGPRAEELSHQAPKQILSTAVAALADSLGLPRRRTAGRVGRVWFHDWTADPYARGAYSYGCVGGEGAARLLARPVKGTLFFAGEATHATRSGTVEGALASGRRAARQVLTALGRR